MAKDKKEFQIVINGLKESVNAVQSLNKELNELDSKLKSLQNAKIQIKVQGNTPDTTKTKVSGNATNDETDKQEQKQNALAKLQQQLAQQRQKNEQLVTEEYQKQYQELVKIREANKEAENIQKQIATGVRDTNGEYSNTLAGQRAYLSELQKSFNSQKMGTEEWRKAADELLRVRELIKGIEQSTGDYRRNVGNYPSGAKELVQLFKDYKEQIDEANSSLNELKESMKGMAENSDEYKSAAVRVAELEEKLNNATQSAEELNNELSKKIQINVGGNIQYFDDLRQASESLTKQLQRLYLEGKSGTKEFDNTIKALGKVKTAINNVSGEVTSFIGNSKGLQDTVTIMNGLTSIASLGVGLQGLFGGQNEDIDKALKKFTALTLVMNGLSNIQKQMNDQTDIFGQYLNKAWNTLDKWTGGLTRSAKQYAILSKLMKGGADETERQARAWDMYMATLDKFDKGAVWDELNTDIMNIARSTGVAITELGEFKDWFNNLDHLRDKLGQDGVDAVEKFKAAFKSEDELNDFISELEDVDIALEIGQGNMTKFQKVLTKIGPVGKVAAQGISLISKAIKGLLASTVILLAVQLAMEAIQKLIEGITAGWNKLIGADTAKLVENFDGLAASVQNANDKLEQLNKLTDRKVANETLNSYQALKERLDNVTKAATEAGNSLREFVSQQENIKPIDFGADFDDAWFSDGNISNMDEFKKRYNLLVKAVSKGVDEVNAKYNNETGIFSGHWWNSLWHTASDAQSSLAEMQLAIISDLQGKINNIDFSKGEQAYQQFIDLINDETYASALANIDELFPEDKWQQGLKTRIEAYKNFAEQMYNLNTQMASSTQTALKQIEDNLNAAITDPFERASAQRKTALERELKEAEGNEKLQESIRKKYQREEADALKAHNKDLLAQAKEANQKRLQAEVTARQAEIDAMKEGLEKQKSILELQKKQALQSAKDQGVAKKTLLLITENYNRQILKLEKDFLDSIEKLYRERDKTMLQLYLDYLSTIRDIDRDINDRQQDIKKKFADFAQEDFEFNLSYNIDTQDPNVIVNYYNKLLEYQQRYNERKKQLDIESEQQQYYRNTNDENDRFNERLRNYEDWLETQNELLKSQLEQGLITEEEYNRMRQENIDTTNQYISDETLAHNNKLEQITQDHEVKLYEINREYTDKTRNYIKQNLDDIIGTYSDFYNKIIEKGERTTKQNTSSIGIINYTKEKQNLKNMQSEFDTMLNNINKEYTALQEAFDNNEISFNDFAKAKKELDSLVKNIKDKQKEVSKNLGELFNTTMQSILQATQQYVQAFSNVYSMISSLIETDLDNQERKLDRQQELLEKEYDMLQEQYEKQEELEQKHTDKINDIEDELKNARGDRREHLVDQLAKEREAQLKALQAEREIELEKQQNQKKQEQLEKQQEALEKKRWEQNKKNQVVQATINTYTAVTNALAVQPWFVGLALSAVALSLGLANVAKIQSQKYYADGGLLNGKSHRQGGIKIPGTGIEVEGNEFVVNKTTTRYNQPLIEYINSKRRPITKDDLINFYDDGKNRLINKNLTNKFADGGQLPTMGDVDVRDLVNYQQPQDNAQYVVSVVDIINASDNVKRVQTLAGIN